MTTDRTPTTAAGRLMLAWYRSGQPTHDRFAAAILGIEAEARASLRCDYGCDACRSFETEANAADFAALRAEPRAERLDVAALLDLMESGKHFSARAMLRAALAPEPETGS